MPKQTFCLPPPEKSKKVVLSKSLLFQTLFGVSEDPFEEDHNYSIKGEVLTEWTKMLRKMVSYQVKKSETNIYKSCFFPPIQFHFVSSDLERNCNFRPPLTMMLNLIVFAQKNFFIVSKSDSLKSFIFFFVISPNHAL